MPVICYDCPPPPSSAFSFRRMGVIEPDEPLSLWIVQRKGVAQPVWPQRRRCDAPDLKLQALATLVPMAAAVERQQELQCVLRGVFYHILSSQDKYRARPVLGQELMNRDCLDGLLIDRRRT